VSMNRLNSRGTSFSSLEERPRVAARRRAVTPRPRPGGPRAAARSTGRTRMNCAGPAHGARPGRYRDPGGELGDQMWVKVYAGGAPLRLGVRRRPGHDLMACVEVRVTDRSGSRRADGRHVCAFVRRARRRRVEAFRVDPSQKRSMIASHCAHVLEPACSPLVASAANRTAASLLRRRACRLVGNAGVLAVPVASAGPRAPDVGPQDPFRASRVAAFGPLGTVPAPGRGEAISARHREGVVVGLLERPAASTPRRACCGRIRHARPA